MLPVDYTLLSSLAHPCVGAFIGYLTNKVAIRMLFRPLRPWHLFGVRVPMTPGIIPAKRRELAVNIGEMVGRHLLTSTDIGSAISKEPFQDHLVSLAEKKVGEIFQRELGPLAEVVPLRFRSYLQIGIKTLKYQIGEGVVTYVGSDDFADTLTDAFTRHLDEMEEREINSLLTSSNRRTVYWFIDELFRILIMNRQVEAWLGEYLEGLVRKAAESNKTFGDVIPVQLAELVRSALGKHIGPLLQRMGGQLADPVLRGQIVQGIITGVEHFLEKLGPVGAMAKGFLEIDTMEQSIGDYLDEKQEDLIQWFENPEVQERMGMALDSVFTSFLEQPLRTFLALLPEEEVAILCHTCAGRLVTVIRSEEVLTELRALLHLGFENMVAGGERSLGEVISQFFTQDQKDEVRHVFFREMMSLFRSGSSERLIHTMVGTMVDGLLTRPLGRLYDLVPHGVRQGIVDYIVVVTNRMLLQEVPGVVQSLNIRQVVIDKVNSLDLLELERLLLSIMEEQFKYINLFGALLGFLIGLINLVLARLTM
ncbi:DUF445 family protein [Desulfobulbus oligotrophicus]|uniref:DUF445 family protein n=1 Tax=Desulfobulbus oligotrophicus TaxID=1909699 RepID=UPI0022B899B8|nr:DUF445 family protein [Desulfobulbus oligotrophicus]